MADNISENPLVEGTIYNTPNKDQGPGQYNNPATEVINRNVATLKKDTGRLAMLSGAVANARLRRDSESESQYVTELKASGLSDEDIEQQVSKVMNKRVNYESGIFNDASQRQGMEPPINLNSPTPKTKEEL